MGGLNLTPAEARENNYANEAFDVDDLHMQISTLPGVHPTQGAGAEFANSWFGGLG